MFELLLSGMIMTAISTAIGVGVNIYTAQQQKKLQEQQARAQADNLRQQAEMEQQDQIQRSIAERRQNARRLASAEASYGASGVTLAGTPTLSLASMSEELELETQMQESASGYKRELLLTEADNVEMFGMQSASLTGTAGMLNAVGTGLSGMTSVAQMGYTGYKDGVFGSKKK